MAEEKSAQEFAPVRVPVEGGVRKPYASPRLIELGSIVELTRGGDQEQRGEGPGFSL